MNNFNPRSIIRQGSSQTSKDRPREIGAAIPQWIQRHDLCANRLDWLVSIKERVSPRACMKKVRWMRNRLLGS